MLNTSLYGQLQQHLIEEIDGGFSWPSGLWTPEEVADICTRRQQEFLRLTHFQIGIAEALETVNEPGDGLVTLPSDWLATVLVLRLNGDGTYTDLPIVDTHQVDMSGDTNTPGTPQFFVDGEGPATLTAQVFPPPSDPTTLEIYYIPIGTRLPAPDIEAEVSVLPDEVLVPGVKWGVIADMLAKVGRGRDDARIEMAQARYDLVVEAARLLLKGLA